MFLHFLQGYRLTLKQSLMPFRPHFIEVFTLFLHIFRSLDSLSQYGCLRPLYLLFLPIFLPYLDPLAFCSFYSNHSFWPAVCHRSSHPRYDHTPSWSFFQRRHSPLCLPHLVDSRGCGFWDRPYIRGPGYLFPSGWELLGKALQPCPRSDDAPNSWSTGCKITSGGSREWGRALSYGAGWCFGGRHSRACFKDLLESWLCKFFSSCTQGFYFCRLYCPRVTRFQSLYPLEIGFLGSSAPRD